MVKRCAFPPLESPVRFRTVPERAGTRSSHAHSSSTTRRENMSGLGGTGAEIKKEIVASMPAVHRFAMRFERSVTDADDLTQDTMLKALAHIDQFRPGTNVKSW